MSATFVICGNLIKHSKTHSGEKPCLCVICGKRFSGTTTLAVHRRKHSGLKPFGCEVCDMKFNSSDHVKRHMRTHTGEKPYKCKYCDRAFAQSNDLVKHTRSHVGDKTYQCEKCPAAFRFHSELKNHGKIHYYEQHGGAPAELEMITSQTGDSQPAPQMLLVDEQVKQQQKEMMKLMKNGQMPVTETASNSTNGASATNLLLPILKSESPDNSQGAVDDIMYNQQKQLQMLQRQQLLLTNPLLTTITKDEDNC